MNDGINVQPIKPAVTPKPTIPGLSSMSSAWGDVQNLLNTVGKGFSTAVKDLGISKWDVPDQIIKYGQLHPSAVPISDTLRNSVSTKEISDYQNETADAINRGIEPAYAMAVTTGAKLVDNWIQSADKSVQDTLKNTADSLSDDLMAKIGKAKTDVGSIIDHVLGVAKNKSLDSFINGLNTVEKSGLYNLAKQSVSYLLSNPANIDMDKLERFVSHEEGSAMDSFAANNMFTQILADTKLGGGTMTLSEAINSNPDLKRLSKQLGQTAGINVGEGAAPEDIRPMLDQLINSSDVNEIKGILGQIGHYDSSIIDGLANYISKTKDPGEIAQLLDFADKVQSGIDSGKLTPEGNSPVEATPIKSLPGGTITSEGVFQEPNSFTTPEFSNTTPDAEVNNVASNDPDVPVIPGETPEMTTAVNKLRDAIKDVKPIVSETERLRSAERAKRVGKMEQVTTPGESGYYEKLAKLKGELPKGQFTPIPFTQAERDAIINRINIQPTLDSYEKINAISGFLKLVGASGGEIPQDSELGALQEILGENTINELVKKSPILSKDTLMEIWNLPKTMLTSVGGHMVSAFRNGLWLSAYKPSAIPDVFKKMFGLYADTLKNGNAFNELRTELANDPLYNLEKQAGLDLVGITKKTLALTAKEEDFMGARLAEKIPVIGKLIKASKNSYVGSMNAFRANVFKSIAKPLLDMGMTFENSPEVFTGIAKLINAASGRGDLGKLTKYVPFFNGMFFSPRMDVGAAQTMWAGVRAYIQVINPTDFYKLPPEVQKTAMKGWFNLIGSGIAILTLASLAGVQVDTDPVSTGWGEMRVGNTRINIWGKYQTFARLISQEIMGKEKTLTGKSESLTTGKYMQPSRLSVLENWATGQLSPAVTAIMDYLSGQTNLGAYSPMNELTNMTYPIWIQSMLGAWADFKGFPAALIPAGLSFLGIGVQTTTPTKSKRLTGAGVHVTL